MGPYSNRKLAGTYSSTSSSTCITYDTQMDTEELSVDLTPTGTFAAFY